MTIVRVLLIGLLLAVSAAGQTVDPGSTIWRVDGTTLYIASIAVSDLADGTAGEVITWDAAGAPATVAVGTAAQVLTSNGAGAAPTFQAAAGGDLVDDISPQLGAQLDVNGFALGDGTLELLSFVETASAINELTITNAAIGNGPTLTATGDDATIPMTIAPKGAVALNLLTGTGQQIILPLDADAVTPTLAFGDGDTGFYQDNDNRIIISHNGVATWVLSAGGLESALGTGAANIPATVGNLVFPVHTFSNDANSGLSRGGADDIGLASGGQVALQLVETGGVVTATMNDIWGSDSQSTTLGSSVTTLAVISNFVILTGDGAANTLATITGATTGMVLRILFVDALVTITDTDAHTADTVDLNAAFTSADDTVMTLLYDGTSWYEAAPRSVN